MEIKSAKYLISSANISQCPKPDRPEYAFIGRSNVGKSSLINMLCNNKKLAKISSSPGKTKLINHFDITSTFSDSPKAVKKDAKWYLVDLPGYGHAEASKKDMKDWSGMITEYIRKRENLGCLFLLIDSRHEPQKIDLDFADKLGEWRIPFVLVFTKSDKNKPGETEKHSKAFLKILSLNWSENPPYFITSSIAKTGKGELLDFLSELNKKFYHAKK
ncbi:MAG TPA: ribosome biogenesis GTP-binding protein YihA/YsxC [Chitinophagaceae bacterium]|nr:ribosome biogenesis GTP-binding protein YihA/YsxC [Chitinophagaceae bacterium]